MKDNKDIMENYKVKSAKSILITKPDYERFGNLMSTQNRESNNKRKNLKRYEGDFLLPLCFRDVGYLENKMKYDVNNVSFAIFRYKNETVGRDKEGKLKRKLIKKSEEEIERERKERKKSYYMATAGEMLYKDLYLLNKALNEWVDLFDAGRDMRTLPDQYRSKGEEITPIWGRHQFLIDTFRKEVYEKVRKQLFGQPYDRNVKVPPFDPTGMKSSHHFFINSEEHLQFIAEERIMLEEITQELSNAIVKSISNILKCPNQYRDFLAILSTAQRIKRTPKGDKSWANLSYDTLDYFEITNKKIWYGNVGFTINKPITSFKNVAYTYADYDSDSIIYGVDRVKIGRVKKVSVSMPDLFISNFNGKRYLSPLPTFTLLCRRMPPILAFLTMMMENRAIETDMNIKDIGVLNYMVKDNGIVRYSTKSRTFVSPEVHRGKFFDQDNDFSVVEEWLTEAVRSFNEDVVIGKSPKFSSLQSQIEKQLYYAKKISRLVSPVSGSNQDYEMTFIPNSNFEFNKYLHTLNGVSALENFIQGINNRYRKNLNRIDRENEANSGYRYEEVKIEESGKVVEALLYQIRDSSRVYTVATRHNEGFTNNVSKILRFLLGSFAISIYNQFRRLVSRLDNEIGEPINKHLTENSLAEIFSFWFNERGYPVWGNDVGSAYLNSLLQHNYQSADTNEVRDTLLNTIYLFVDYFIEIGNLTSMISLYPLSILDLTFDEIEDYMSIDHTTYERTKKEELNFTDFLATCPNCGKSVPYLGYKTVVIDKSEEEENGKKRIRTICQVHGDIEQCWECSNTSYDIYDDPVVANFFSFDETVMSYLTFKKNWRFINYLNILNNDDYYKNSGVLSSKLTDYDVVIWKEWRDEELDDDYGVVYEESADEEEYDDGNEEEERHDDYDRVVYEETNGNEPEEPELTEEQKELIEDEERRKRGERKYRRQIGDEHHIRYQASIKRCEEAHRNVNNNDNSVNNEIDGE